VEQCVLVTCTVVEGRDGVRLWLTKESGSVPTCVEPKECFSCTTKLVASQLQRSYVVLRAEYHKGRKADACVLVAALSARVLKLVAQQVVPVLTLGWSWRSADLDEEVSARYVLGRLADGMFSCEGCCICRLASAEVCAKCKVSSWRQGALFISERKFRGVRETSSKCAPDPWWAGVTDAAEGTSEGVDGATVSWLECPLLVW
jgi:hypothetical protein